MRLDHTFPTNTEKSRISAKWLAKTCESLFRSDPTTSIHTLMDNCKEKYGVDVGRHMAYRAKNLVVEAVLGEHKKQYPRLRDYAQTIMDTNPGSRVVVTTVISKPTTNTPHPGPRFHAMFFCINGAREGFLNGCRPFIGVDGCFIKLTTGAQILAATGRDGNNNIFPLGFAIVGQEDTADWCRFLHQLKICLGGETGKFGPYTIMFDRQKNAGFRGEDLKKYMDNDSYAYNQHKFNIAMNDLKNESEEAWKWLSGIPKNTWARHAFDTNCKTDLVVNNLSEVFNNYILDFTKRPIRTMIMPMIYPVPGEHDWTRTSGPDIEPPTFHVKRGRKKEKRIKGKFEVPKPKDSSRMDTITCSNCGLQGHTYTNCRQQLRRELAVRKNKHVPTTARSHPPTARPRSEARSQPPPARSTRRSISSASVHRPFTTPRFAAPGSSSSIDGGSSSAPAPRFAAVGSSSAPGGSSAAPTPTNHYGWMAFFTASGNHN
ncbi:WD repeat-containing protein 43 [Hordeum vulgare]|nr:WD repeat-containing protein 43 [Hordeum vulgare]